MAILLGLVAVALNPVSEDGDWRLGLGSYFVNYGGYDFQLDYQPRGSPWIFGARVVGWTDGWEQESGVTQLSRERHKKMGFLALYDFDVESPRSFYIGGEILRWTALEISGVNGQRDTGTLVHPYIGGGYAGRISTSSFNFNIGLFFGIGRQMKTQTLNTVEQSAIDLHIQLSYVF